jgi:hypothetical protein
LTDTLVVANGKEALIAKVLPEQKQQWFDAGMDGFVGKALQRKELTLALFRRV